MGLLPPPPPDDEDRRRFLAGGAGGAGGAGSLSDSSLPESGSWGVHIPDDLRGLEDEIRAVQAELGIDPLLAAAPRTRRGRLAAWFRRHARLRPATAPFGRGWPPSQGLTRSLLVGPVVAVTLLVIAGLVALLPSPAPGPVQRAPVAERLATPSQPPGTVGGLLPDVVLESPTGPVDARALRPAVLMLVPDGCACPGLVHDLVGQVEEYPGISAVLVGSGDPAVRRLAVQSDGGNGRLPALVDRTSALAGAYHGGPPGSAPTVLFVEPDGILASPPLVFTAGTRIEAALMPLGRLHT